MREGTKHAAWGGVAGARWRPFDVLNPLGRLTALRSHYADALQRTPDHMYWWLFCMWMMGVVGIVLWAVLLDTRWTVGGVRVGLLIPLVPIVGAWVLVKISRVTLATYIEAAELEAARRHFDVEAQQGADGRAQRAVDGGLVQRFRLRCFEIEHRAMAGEGLLPFDELTGVQGSAWRPLNVLWAFGVPMPADYVASGLQRIPGYVYWRAVGATILAWMFFGFVGVLVLMTPQSGGSMRLIASSVALAIGTVTYANLSKRYAKRLLAYARGSQVAVKG